MKGASRDTLCTTARLTATGTYTDLSTVLPGPSTIRALDDSQDTLEDTDRDNALRRRSFHYDLIFGCVY